MLDRHPLGLYCRLVRVVQHEHALGIAAEHGHGDEALAVPDRGGGLHGPPQQAVPVLRGVLRVGIGTPRACPRPQVSEAVLDGRGVTGQVVDGLGDPFLALPRQRYLGQPVVDLHRAPQRQVAGPQLLCLIPLAGVQARVGQRHPGLLGQDLQEEPLGLGGFLIRPDHQEASRPARAGQRIGPRPWHPPQPEPRTFLREGGFGQVRAREFVVRQPDLGPPPVQEDALGHAVPERLDGVRDQAQDPGLIVLPGQEHGQHQQAPQGGKLLPERIIAWGQNRLDSGRAGRASRRAGRQHGGQFRPTRNLPGST